MGIKNVQRVTFRCDICGKEKIKEFEILNRNSVVIRPDIPAGWREVGGRLVCGKHKVIILVDGIRIMKGTKYNT